jgi:hypothetical protein
MGGHAGRLVFLVAVGCRVPLGDLLTSADLDEIGHAAFDVDEPLVLAGELVAAVEQGRVAEKPNVGFALILAAEITEREGDLGGALALAERADEAYRQWGNAKYGFPRAFRAELLLRVGREDEAMAEFAALRPLMGRDPDAVSYVSEALETAGRAEIAEQWLSEDLPAALRRREALDGRRGEEYGQAAMVAYALAQQRYRLRRDLGLPLDEHDRLAGNLRETLQESLADGPAGRELGPAVLFWPKVEFDTVVLRWPVLAGVYGRTWDDHRAQLQKGLELMAASGDSGLAVVAGSAEQLAGYATRHDGDPTDPDIRAGYAQHLLNHPRETPWPPGRNDACWCGSQVKYKKCCLPRSRA